MCSTALEVAAPEPTHPYLRTFLSQEPKLYDMPEQQHHVFMLCGQSGPKCSWSNLRPRL